MPRVPDSFYERDGDRYLATDLTRGPWDPGAQHAGPPGALIAREIERLGGGRLGNAEGPPAQVGRITYDLLRSVPIAPLTVEAEIVRPGRSVELVRAKLADADGEVIRAHAWRLRTTEVELRGAARQAGGPTRAGGGAARRVLPHRVRRRLPHGDGVPLPERSVHGGRSGEGLDADGGAAGPGEEPTPLQRVLAAADSGNGVSAALDWRSYLFINVDLSVHLHRMPAGEWVCLDAVTLPERSGVGLADTQLHDQRGPIGRALQTLLVDRRQTG